MELTRNLFIPYIDTSQKGAAAATWVRVDKSDAFELSFNPQTDTKSYIDSKNDTTVISSYQAELPLNIVVDNSNDAYNFVIEFAKKFPVGNDAVVPIMILIPQKGMDSATVTDTTVFDALVWESAIMQLDTLNSTDGNISFGMELNGDAIVGTASGVKSGTVEFTEATPVVVP